MHITKHTSMPPRTTSKKKNRSLRRRNSVRKQLNFAGKKKSPNRNRASYKVHSRKGKNILALLERTLSPRKYRSSTVDEFNTDIMLRQLWYKRENILDKKDNNEETSELERDYRNHGRKLYPEINDDDSLTFVGLMAFFNENIEIKNKEIAENFKTLIEEKRKVALKVCVYKLFGKQHTYPKINRPWLFDNIAIQVFDSGVDNDDEEREIYETQIQDFWNGCDVILEVLLRNESQNKSCFIFYKSTGPTAWFINYEMNPAFLPPTVNAHTPGPPGFRRQNAFEV